MKKPLGLSIEPHPAHPKYSVLRFDWKTGTDVHGVQAAYPKEPHEQTPEVMAEFLLNFAVTLRRKAR